MDLDGSKTTAALLEIIPKLKKKIHLAAFALVVVLLVFLNYDGFRVLPSALTLATIPVVIIATYFPTLTPGMGDLPKIICLFIILLFSFLLIVLAFYYDNKEKKSYWISWEGKMEFFCKAPLCNQLSFSFVWLSCSAPPSDAITFPFEQPRLTIVIW